MQLMSKWQNALLSFAWMYIGSCVGHQLLSSHVFKTTSRGGWFELSLRFNPHPKHLQAFVLLELITTTLITSSNGNLVPLRNLGVFLCGFFPRLCVWAVPYMAVSIFFGLNLFKKFALFVGVTCRSYHMAANTKCIAPDICTS